MGMNGTESLVLLRSKGWEVDGRPSSSEDVVSLFCWLLVKLINRGCP